jgi:hypothetical protein
MGPMHWIHRWGLAYGIYPWVSTLVMGNLMGKRFWVGRGCFFLGGGGGEEELQGTTAETFSQDDTSSKQSCLCYILYIDQWGFAAVCLQANTKGVLDPRLPWTDTYTVRLRQLVDLVHTLKTVKGLLLLVPARNPRSSAGPHLITLS